MDLVAEYDETAGVPETGIGGGQDGGVDVGRAVGAGKGGVAHRAGDDDRLPVTVVEVEEEGRLLDAVGALDDDDAVDVTGFQLRGDRGRQSGEVVERQRGTGQTPEVPHLQADSARGQGGHRGQQFVGRQRGYDASGGGIRGHGDRAAEGEDRHGPDRRRHIPVPLSGSRRARHHAWFTQASGSAPAGYAE
ncbi:hypothetical protein GCM10017687_33430 [Streptomyces echinatus]